MKDDPLGADADEAMVGWRWAGLDREYQAMIAVPRGINRQLKPPSAGTCDDVRLAFARRSIQDLQPTALIELTRPQIAEALQKISNHRQREKCCAYFKAAMTWAADKRR